jgi:hypothetical protein
MPPAIPSARAVAGLLRDRDTRAATLKALDTHSVPIDTALSLAAAPALAELLALDAAEVEREQFDCVGLLLARLLAEAAATDDQAAVAAAFGAAYGGGRLAAMCSAEGTALAHGFTAPAAELSRADAYSHACWWAHVGPMGTRGISATLAAAGLTGQEWLRLFSRCVPATNGSWAFRLSSISIEDRWCRSCTRPYPCAQETDVR